MWGRVIIGAVVIVLVAVWLAAIWILFADPRVLPWKWWMPKEISSSSTCRYDPDPLAASRWAFKAQTEAARRRQATPYRHWF